MIIVSDFQDNFILLQNGVRGLMLDMNDYKDEIWLCQGMCSRYTAFVRHFVKISSQSPLFKVKVCCLFDILKILKYEVQFNSNLRFMF